MDRAGEVSFLVIPRRLNLGLLALEHPHRADLGVGVDIDLVLEDGRLVIGQLGQELPQLSQLDPTFLLVRLQDGARPTVDHFATMQPSTDRLATDVQMIKTQHQEGDDLATSSAAEEAEVARGLGTDQVDDGQPSGTEAKVPAGLVPGHGLDSFPVEPLDPSVDRPGAAEQERRDGGPGVAIGQQQQDMGAEADLGVGVLTISVEQRLALPASRITLRVMGASARCGN